ncbi:SET domain-containing protein-lysine N-methyltransferase [Janthinobacterium sp. 17J80-10]|uniref:SET domain-containing protein n=1 Tax=Janthinobacterium sp. 17J80-10 TaxID=2497863 RepID=UPI0010057D83|nr:SET domain-containing protein-lysine N-methyltransferase [Janthinobacterium sp. 17J80-10]QAU32923.1 SET domain-containing protein-lysine N-methyltransferase [Janthinobacterium sp. 17J80-10]
MYKDIASISVTPDSSANVRRGPAFVVRGSRIHGRGVFAAREIAAGTRLVEYKGERITEEQAIERHGRDPENPHHTFFFSLEDGRMIDGDAGGNNARWINHACEPNCEAREENGRVFIYALHDIAAGEELGYDYGLVLDARQTAAVKRDYACRCGAQSCRKTMLAPRRKKPLRA